jgi:hypothetical protein
MVGEMEQKQSQTISPSADTSETKSSPPNLSLLSDLDLTQSVSYLIRIRKYVCPSNAGVISIQARRVKDKAVQKIENREGSFWYNSLVVEICNTLDTECYRALHK